MYTKMENQNNNSNSILPKSGIIIAVIIIASIVLFTKLNSIEQKLNQLNNTVQSNNYSDVDYSYIKDIVAEELENQTYLNIQTEWDSEYKDKKIHLNCSVILSQAKADDVITFFYKNYDDTIYKSTVLTKGEGLRYSGSITLELFKEYEYYVILEGEIIQSSKVASIPWEYYLIEPISFGSEVGTKNNKDESVIIHVYDFLTEKTLIKGISVELLRIDLYSNDQVIDSQIIKDEQDRDSVEILFNDYEETIEKIVMVTILTDGLELEHVVYAYSGEIEIEEEKRG